MLYMIDECLRRYNSWFRIQLYKLNEAVNLNVINGAYVNE